MPLNDTNDENPYFKLHFDLDNQFIPSDILCDFKI